MGTPESQREVGHGGTQCLQRRGVSLGRTVERLSQALVVGRSEVLDKSDALVDPHRRKSRM